MNIFDKIDEIRRKPEHIRLRYVWASVAVSMVLVIFIWIISLKSGIVKNKSNQNSQQDVSGSEILNNLKESGDALKEMKQGVDTFKEAQKNQAGNFSENIGEQEGFQPIQ